MKAQTRGFTLVEMAIVFVVIGLLLGGLLIPLSTQIESKQRTETKKMLGEIKEALIGYALSNGYLPCPDSDTPPDGGENRAGNICTGNNSGDGVNRSWHGVIPWIDLGIENADPWATRFTYAVMETFSDQGTLFTLMTTRNLRVRDGNGVNIIGDAPAVFVSHGKNRFGGTGLLGVIQANSPSHHERENVDYDRTFRSRTYSMLAPNSNSQFDDLVHWVSPNILFNRMVAARMLP